MPPRRRSSAVAGQTPIPPIRGTLTTDGLESRFVVVVVVVVVIVLGAPVTRDYDYDNRSAIASLTTRPDLPSMVPSVSDAGQP